MEFSLCWKLVIILKICLHRSLKWYLFFLIWALKGSQHSLSQHLLRFTYQRLSVGGWRTCETLHLSSLKATHSTEATDPGQELLGSLLGLVCCLPFCNMEAKIVPSPPWECLGGKKPKRPFISTSGRYESLTAGDFPWNSAMTLLSFPFTWC